MGYQTIEVRNSTPHIGAEIGGVDLSNPLGNQQFQEVHDALMDRLVIFFRDQKLSIREAYNGCCPCGHRHSAVCLYVYIDETMRGDSVVRVNRHNSRSVVIRWSSAR